MNVGREGYTEVRRGRRPSRGPRPALAGGLSKPAGCRSVRRMFIDPVAFKALQNTLSDIEALISTATALPEDTTPRCLELLQTAKALMNDMLKRASTVQ